MTKVALVTGACGGIGSAISRALVDDGYRVIATHFPSKTEIAAEWRREQGFTEQEVRLLPLDVTDREFCTESLNTLLAEEGRLDVIVNNAGITRDGMFKKMTGEQWDQVMTTNLTSLFNVTQPLFAKMCDQGHGRIINITSVNGIKGQIGQVNYSAAKAGVIGFTKALAGEGARYGITVNAIAPGYTATPMVTAIREDVLEGIVNQVPLKRLAEPAEVAASVLFLAGDHGAYITGETISVNGGLHMH